MPISKLQNSEDSTERQLPPTSQTSSSQKSGSPAFFPSKARLAAAGVILLLVMGFFLIRLTFLQVVSPDRYVEWGNSQRFRSFQISAPRGGIMDRNGEPLAVSLRSETIWADPQLIQNPEQVAAALVPVLDMEYSEIYKRVTLNTSFSYLKRKVSDKTSQEVADLKLSGVFSSPEYKRSSPSGEDLGLSVLGFVGSEEQGLGGIEFSFDDVLAGTNGRVALEGNVQGQIVDPELRSIIPAKPGKDLLLSIDKGLQYEAERLILKAVEDYEAQSGIVLATSPTTGEILAMATAIGSEDGANISDDNRAITWAYEPGSAIKALTFSAILDANIGEPSSIREVPDTYLLYDSEFTDHDPHPDEKWSISDIVTISSNVGTILWTEELGKTYLDFYYREFGLGQPSNIELPGESSGLLLETKLYSGTSIATIPLGQGISVTPLQLLYGFNTLANGGVYVPPKLVLATAEGDDWEHYDHGLPNRQVVTQETASQMTEILTRVVSEGTGIQAQVDGYTVAGKTGTARKPQPGGGYLDEDGYFHYVTTFAGFYPAENPQVSIIVVIEEPQNSIYASATAAPVFSDLAAFSANRFQISPTIRQITSFDTNQ